MGHRDVASIFRVLDGCLHNKSLSAGWQAQVPGAAVRHGYFPGANWLV